MMVRRMLCVTYTRLEDVIKQADALGRSDVQLSPSRPCWSGAVNFLMRNGLA